jgi:hypothetical protein
MACSRVLVDDELVERRDYFGVKLDGEGYTARRHGLGSPTLSEGT